MNFIKIKYLNVMHKQLLIAKKINSFPLETASVMMMIIWILLIALTIILVSIIFHPVFDLKNFRNTGAWTFILLQLAIVYLHYRCYKKVSFIKLLESNANNCGWFLNKLSYFLIPLLWSILFIIVLIMMHTYGVVTN